MDGCNSASNFEEFESDPEFGQVSAIPQEAAEAFMLSGEADAPATFDVKYIYINDVYAAYRLNFILEALKGSRINKFRMIFDSLPRTHESPDVVIVGGNDPDRLASFIKVNLPILRAVPKVALASSLNPKKRANLLDLGFDDVLNVPNITHDEFYARIKSLSGRYAEYAAEQARIAEYNKELETICFAERLTRTQRKILCVLWDAQGKTCRYLMLQNCLTDNYEPASLDYLRVAISMIRLCLKPGVKIENVKGQGYRLNLP